MANETPEWDLVWAAQHGDRDAFGALYTRYRPEVYRYALYRTREPWWAEDVTSETFLRALRRLDTLTHQGADVGAWLFTITRNILADHFKSARHQRDQTVWDVEDHPDAMGDPEWIVAQREATRVITDAVNRLGLSQRTCVFLRFERGYTVADTALAMGRTPSAIKALTHRAVVALRVALIPKEAEPNNDQSRHEDPP